MAISLIELSIPYILKDYEVIDTSTLEQRIQSGTRRLVPPTGEDSEVDITPESLRTRYAVQAVALNDELQTGQVRFRRVRDGQYVFIADMNGALYPTTNNRMIFHLGLRRSIFPIVEDDEHTITIHRVVLFEAA